MNFKEQRLADEFNQLYGKNQDLYTIAIQVDTFCRLEFKKEITVTCIFRTKAENDALYAATPPDQRPARSPHMDWNALDLRSSDFTPTEITRMLSFLNCYHNKNGKPTAIYHQIAGNVMHFHAQRLTNEPATS